jgi:hypothetical protein
VEKAAARYHLQFLDLRSAYRHLSAAQLRLLPEDPIHPNVEGHRLAGGALAALLTSKKLLPDSP